MRRDDIPTIQLGSWPVSATLLDGDKLAGLFPTLFSEDPEVDILDLGKDRHIKNTEYQLKNHNSSTS